MLAPAWAPCWGESHRNAHIDHCGGCMPFWGRIPVCPSCNVRLLVTRTRKVGRCINPRCERLGTKFDLTMDREEDNGQDQV